MIKVRIENLNKIITAFQIAPKRTSQEVQKAIKKSVLMVERESKKVTPVRTGRLRASIYPDELSETKGVISPHTDYALTVHEGLGIGRNAEPRPFMQWGTETAYPRIQEFFKQALDNIVKSLVK